MTILGRAWAIAAARIRDLRFSTTTADLGEDARAIYAAVSPYTMTNVLRISALVHAVEYVVRNDLPGALVECGVWRGGSVLAMLLKLKQLGISNRDVYLYDTFEGMTQPDERDTSAFERPAARTWHDAVRTGRRPWDALFKPEVFSLDQVRKTVLGSGYPPHRVHFVKGDVTATLPSQAPEKASLLRLDTDWYASTAHELLHLYPRLSPGGVLIIDDYGHWRGCRRAVDEYFSNDRMPFPLLNRIDYAARLALKP